MKKCKVITIIIFISLFCILIGLHAFLIYKLLPIINNIQKLTDTLNSDYDIVYKKVMDILNETTIIIDDTNNILNKTHFLIDDTNIILQNTNHSLKNLNNTITNFNNTINNLEENLKIDL